MEERTRLYLARHGETTTSSEFRFIGHMDVDITENGVEQMTTLRDRLMNDDLNAIFCSDLLRSRKGAEIIGSLHEAQPVPCSIC